MHESRLALTLVDPFSRNKPTKATKIKEKR
jgi:hypothetical protein